MKLYFRVDRLRPDQRQYRQTEIELVPSDPLLVEVDISDEYQLGLVDDGVITLAGLKEIISQCDLVFQGSSRTQRSDEIDDIEWEQE